MEITATPDLSKVKAIVIQKLTKGFIVQASASQHTLGPMNVWDGACATENEVLDEVGKLLGLVVGTLEVTADPVRPTHLVFPGQEPIPLSEITPVNVNISSSTHIPPKPFDPATDLPVTAENRDQVIDWLVERNIEPVKGVRNTTLTKMVEDELAKIAKAGSGEVVAKEEPTPAVESVETETAVELEIDTSFECKLCFGTSELPGGAPCPHCAKGGDLTLEIVRNAGNIILNGDEAKRDGVRKAIATACGTLGIKGLREVKDFNVAWKVLHAEIAKVFNTDKTETDEWVM